MKKLLTILLAAAMVLGMTVTAGAADAKLEKTYEEAAHGDLLFTADFSSTGGVFAPHSVNSAVDALANVDPVVSDGGKTVTLRSTADATTNQLNIWGDKIEELKASSTTSYTMTYKVRANGQYGKNNSIGVGGWFLEEWPTAGEDEYKHYANYGNHNTLAEDGTVYPERRTALSWANTKMGDYVYGVQEAYEDADGYITLMIEFDGPSQTFTSYYANDEVETAEWIKLESQPMAELSDNDCMCVMFYVWYAPVDTTVSDLKIFKGIGLTNEQLTYDPVAAAAAAAEAAAAEAAAAAAAENAAVATAPQTFDAGVIAAVSAIVSAAGYMLTKKR